MPDKSNTGKQLALDSKENARKWYKIFRGMALEDTDFMEKRSQKSVKR